MSSEIERVDDLASGWLRAWTGDGAFDVCCAPDVQYEDPLAPDPLRGVDDLERHAARIRGALPDLRIERTGDVLANDEFACVPWRLAATHKNDTAGLPATNRFVALHGLHYLELADERIRRGRGFFDLYDAATQLGILPARGGLGESLLLFLRGFGLRSS
ncbi:MAG TPA: ester cyclase [Thermoleophilaceae bacterium]